MTDLMEINAEFYKPYLTILKYFRYTGIDLFDEKNIFLFRYKNIHICIFIYYVFISSCHIRYVIEEVYSGTDLLELSVDLSFCCNTIEGCLIYLYICIIRERIQKFVIKLESQWRCDDNITPDIILLKRDQVKMLDLYNFMFCKLTQVFVHCYMAIPFIIIVIKKFILEYSVEYVTPLKLTTPFEYKENFAKFIIVYAMDYMMVCSLAYLINGSLFLLTVTINQLGTQFILLKEEFKEIIHSKDSNVDRKLKETIKRHSILSDMIAQLSHAYGAIFAIHLLFLSFTICFYGIAARINCRLEDIKNLMISVITIVNIYYCCKHGQHLTDSALAIATEIYDSSWEDLSCQNQKMILLTMLRSQRANCVQSTNFTEISLNTFIKIMNLAWSFISLITTMYED